MEEVKVYYIKIYIYIGYDSKPMSEWSFSFGLQMWHFLQIHQQKKTDHLFVRFRQRVENISEKQHYMIF